MSYNPTYDKGNWLAICDDCGQKFKANILKLRWDGLMVCPADWEPRQPQDFVRAKIDIQAVPWSRPEASDYFIPEGTVNGTSGIAWFAIAGIAIADKAYNTAYVTGTVPPGTFKT